jgi:LPXTG-motif cell wall-anchored protein
MELTNMQENITGPIRSKKRKRVVRHNTDGDNINFINELNFTDEELNAAGLFATKLKGLKEKLKTASQKAKTSGILSKIVKKDSNLAPITNSEILPPSSLPETNNKKKWFMIGGGVILVGIIALVIYKIKKKK